MVPFALAFKKNKKSSFVVVELVDGELLFQVNKRSQPELRADLAPWVRHPQGKASPTSPVAVPSLQASDQGDERLRRLKDLGELRDAGVLTDEEFGAEKARVLGREA